MYKCDACGVKERYWLCSQNWLDPLLEDGSLEISPEGKVGSFRNTIPLCRKCWIKTLLNYKEGSWDSPSYLLYSTMREGNKCIDLQETYGKYPSEQIKKYCRGFAKDFAHRDKMMEDLLVKVTEEQRVSTW